jgi:hypothetical protein
VVTWYIFSRFGLLCQKIWQPCSRVGENQDFMTLKTQADDIKQSLRAGRIQTGGRLLLYSSFSEKKTELFLPFMQKAVISKSHSLEKMIL